MEAKGAFRLGPLVRSGFWAVPFMLAAAGALLDVEGVSALVSATLALGAKERALAPPIAHKRSAVAAEFHSRSADAILARNPFDSTTGPLLGALSAAADGPAAGAIAAPEDAPPCDGVRVLAIAASEDDDWSFAALTALTATGSAKPLLRRRGGDVGTKRVAHVGWDRVWLWTPSPASEHGVGDGALCQAVVYAPSPDGPATAALPGAGHAGLDPSIAQRIERLGPTEFNVDRSVVERVLENQASFVKGIRIAPEQEGGRTVGIRLLGIRPDSLFGAIGLLDGDRLQTINGLDVTSPEKALQAYAQLPTWDHLTVQVNRKGQDTNIDLHLK